MTERSLQVNELQARLVRSVGFAFLNIGITPDTQEFRRAPDRLEEDLRELFPDMQFSLQLGAYGARNHIVRGLAELSRQEQRLHIDLSLGLARAAGGSRSHYRAASRLTGSIERGARTLKDKEEAQEALHFLATHIVRRERGNSV